MTNLAYIRDDERFINHWSDCYARENKNTGMVALLDLSKIGSKNIEQFFFTYDTFGKIIEITERAKPYTNVYLSLNAFRSVNGSIKRQTRNLAQIRNIGIDLDCYKLGISPEQCKKQLNELIMRNKLPNPNLVINSGNGVQLIYSIKNGAAPTHNMKWYAMYITKELTSQLTHLGSDHQTCSLERVFRLPYTLNKKDGRATKLVTCEIWNRQEFTLQELYEYVEPYKPAKKRKKMSREIPLMGFKKGSRTLPQMNMARANDLTKLVFLREGRIENRNILSYDYAFSLALGSDLSRSEVQEATAQLDAKFTEQQKRNVLRNTVKSAYDDAEEFWKAYAKNFHNMKGLDKNLVKPKQTRTLIRQHEITEAEMQQLEVLIGKAEKEHRRTEKRRDSGEKTTQQYNEERAAQVKDKLQQLKALKEKHPKASQRKLAEMMGVSQSTVRNLFKKL